MLLVEKLFSVLAPHECLGCGREGSLLCAWCRPDAISPLPSRCYRCHALTTDHQVCDKCRKHTPMRHAWIAADYDGVLKELIHHYKFERTKDAAGILAEILDEVAPHFSKETILSYVPTATSRVRQRGYDQAAELAKAFARRRGLKVSPLLYRDGQSRQVGANRKDRLKQLDGVFRPRNEQQIRKASIILIDDIVTTGATLEAASKILKKAGAKSVNALAVAQKH